VHTDAIGEISKPGRDSDSPRHKSFLLPGEIQVASFPATWNCQTLLIWHIVHLWSVDNKHKLRREDL
jgi:hypothetical protein